MKKSFLLLPLSALMLTACSNSGSSVNSTDPSISEWQTESVQMTEMPASMGNYGQPTYSHPTYSQPTYNQTTYNQSYGSGYSENVGSCQVVRDSMNKPIYSQIQKGCYQGNTYTVGRFDTLFLIGYLTGQSANQIAAMNGISTTGKLKVGQTLRVR